VSSLGARQANSGVFSGVPVYAPSSLKSPSRGHPLMFKVPIGDVALSRFGHLRLLKVVTRVSDT
jgi:hypothetical protein